MFEVNLKFHEPSYTMPEEQSIFVSFNDLRKRFGGQTVLDGISGEIRQGEVIILRGVNGSGKTTLLNILTGCLEPDSGTMKFFSESGAKDKTFHFPRAWHQDLNPFQRFTPEQVAHLGMGRTWQDIRLFSSLDLVDNICASSARSIESPWAALFRRGHIKETCKQDRLVASKSLEALGVYRRGESSADKVSLGQSKRVAIVRALQANTKILFLDEPLAGLDVDGVRDVVSQLRSLATEQGLAIVIVEHALNIPCLIDIVTAVWTLKNGGLTVTKPAAVKKELENVNTRTDIHALIRRGIRQDVPFTRRSLPLGAVLTTYWLFNGDSKISRKTILQIDRLVMERGTRALFDTEQRGEIGLCLSLFQGTVNVLDAPNGWGKTSLALRLVGFVSQKSGFVKLCGKDLSASPDGPLFYSIGGRCLRSQDYLFPSLSIRETYRLVDIEDANMEDNSATCDQIVGSLSGGEGKSLALSCLGRGIFMILDELQLGLDEKALDRNMADLLENADHECHLYLHPSSIIRP